MRTVVCLLTAGFAAGLLMAQQPLPAPDAAKPKRPEPKNLKILKVSGPELITIMRSFNTALGVQCVHCHVQGDFASDEKPVKETARMMITMSHEINEKFGDGKLHVSCFTCHRGAVDPVTMPPTLPPPAAPPPPPAPAP